MTTQQRVIVTHPRADCMGVLMGMIGFDIA